MNKHHIVEKLLKAQTTNEAIRESAADVQERSQEQEMVFERIQAPVALRGIKTYCILRHTLRLKTYQNAMSLSFNLLALVSQPTFNRLPVSSLESGRNGGCSSDSSPAL